LVVDSGTKGLQSYQPNSNIFIVSICFYLYKNPNTAGHGQQKDKLYTLYTHITFHISVDIMHAWLSPNRSISLQGHCIHSHLLCLRDWITLAKMPDCCFCNIYTTFPFWLLSRLCNQIHIFPDDEISLLRVIRLGSSRVIAVSTVHNVHIAVNEDRAREVFSKCPTYCRRTVKLYFRLG
jgi:hypothetical protein